MILGFVHAKFVGAQLQSICEWKRQVTGQLPIFVVLLFLFIGQNECKL